MRLSSSVYSLSTVALLLFACSSSSDGTSDRRGAIAGVTNTPCGNELKGQCGDACSGDAACPDGQYCSGTSCTAECTTEGEQCNGTCDARGRCDGELIVTAPSVAPQDMDDDIILTPSDGDPTSPTPGTGSPGNTESCGGVRLSADLKPVNMFISFDRSLSMADNNKWEQATGALSDFIADPVAADLGVALRFFGDDTCNDNDCSIAACRDPLVDLGTLTTATGAADVQEQALLGAIDAADPDFLGTPIYAALGGALDWAENYQGANPDQTTVVVLVTDGEPRGCNEDINAIAGLAGDAFARSGVRTYAVGLEGSNPGQMDAIAEQGNTGQGYLIGGSGDAAAELAVALNDIRGRSLACEFAVPTPTTGAVVASEVNVLFTQGGTTEPLGAVSGAGACGTESAWYFDDPSAPTTIYLCDAACDRALSSSDAELEVLLGCPTGSVPPEIF